VIVELRGICHHYRRGADLIEVLGGVDLSLEPGDFVAVMGASGSGKSTLLHILGCLLRPSRGSYLLDRVEVLGRAERELAGIRSRRIAHVFQMFYLLPHLDVVQNVFLPFLYQDGLTRAEAGRRVDQAIDRVGLQGRRSHRPAELSGGELQRVAIARALAARPDLILADEPTGNLDARNSGDILDLFQSMNDDGHTIVMVTHDREVASRARRLVTLCDGMLHDG
jgi:putative ABC transport system ATP-binding protein